MERYRQSLYIPEATILTKIFAVGPWNTCR